ncbi:MAG: Ubiquinone/menaquinone biosynthesis C-methyltransferase UbiE [Fimbriimonadales bacterium]|nr:Ubiquinone/menaquinone biosynthesis C-methyltransferase UbiE [Fimbriimonadales bacterium]
MGSSQVQGALWGAHPEDWATFAEPTTSALWDALIAGVGVSDGVTLLDMGCGAGGLATKAAQKGAKVTGIDAAETLIEIAKGKLPRGEFHVCDIENLPFENDTFDAVIACNSIQFAEDRVAAAKEAKRVLRPGGRFGIGMWCEPEKCEFAPIFKAVQEIMPPPPRPPEPLLSERANLLDVIDQAGFNVLDEKEVDCLFHFGDDDQFWRGLRAAGMMVAAARTVGAEKLREALLSAARPHKDSDGGYRFVNRFRCVIAD